MEIAFFSNFLNHHQLPLCEAFLAQDEVKFTFVATEPIPNERQNMGYADINKKYSFVLCAYENEENLRKAEDLAKNCDLMIFGSAPQIYLELRMAGNKLVFYFSERILKKGSWRRFIPITYKKIYNGYIRYKDKNLYVLGASAYTSYDLKLCGFDANKCFKWGYFPRIRENYVNDLLARKSENSVIEILYAGRLLSGFRFTIIGDGEQKQAIEEYVQKYRLEQYIRLLPFMPADNVRVYMDSADIYVFSSNRHEGWGAVVNEAMDSACAMVVSHAVGSVPYLIQNGENGLVYQSGNILQLAEKLKQLIENQNYRENLAKRAHEIIHKEWTAEIAVARLLQLYKSLVKGENASCLFTDGVCSKAPLLKNNWLKVKE